MAGFDTRISAEVLIMGYKYCRGDQYTVDLLYHGHLEIYVT